VATLEENTCHEVSRAHLDWRLAVCLEADLGILIITILILIVFTKY